MGVIAEHWQRYRLSGGLPIGVVSGPANALPREWARAWQVCRAGDAERMDQVRQVLEGFQLRTREHGKRSIACLKHALASMGVIQSASVAFGTPDLEPEDAQHFAAAFEQIRELSREVVGTPWVTEPPRTDVSGVLR